MDPEAEKGNYFSQQMTGKVIGRKPNRKRTNL